MPGLTWALTFAIAADPLHRRLQRHIARANVAAAAGVLSVAIALVVPATFVIWQISTEARRGFEQVTAMLASGRWEENLRSHPAFGRAYSAIASQIDLASELKSLTTNMPKQAGTFVVGSIDNVLYPMLVGSEMRMHTPPVFVVTIGGLVIFGAAGIVLGPIILAATVAMLEIFRRRTRREERAQHLPAP